MPSLTCLYTEPGEEIHSGSYHTYTMLVTAVHLLLGNFDPLRQQHPTLATTAGQGAT